MKKSFFLTLAVLVLAQGMILIVSMRGEVQMVENSLDQIPHQLGEWTGKDDKFNEEIYQVLNADATILRNYKNLKDYPMWLYIGYYGTKKGGRSNHQPRYCYPGSGWDILDISKEPIQLSNGRKVEINKIIVQRGHQKNVALYWNHSGENRVLDSGLKMNISRFVRRVTTNRDDGAFIRISAPVIDGDLDNTLELEKQFAAKILDVLPKYWPVEQEI